MQRYSFKVDGEYRRPTPDDAGAFYDVAIVDARIAELEKALASSPCACTLEMVQATNIRRLRPWPDILLIDDRFTQRR